MTFDPKTIRSRTFQQAGSMGGEKQPRNASSNTGISMADPKFGQSDVALDAPYDPREFLKNLLVPPGFLNTMTGGAGGSPPKTPQVPIPPGTIVIGAYGIYPNQLYRFLKTRPVYIMATSGQDQRLSLINQLTYGNVGGHGLANVKIDFATLLSLDQPHAQAMFKSMLSEKDQRDSLTGALWNVTRGRYTKELVGDDYMYELVAGLHDRFWDQLKVLFIRARVSAKIDELVKLASNASDINAFEKNNLWDLALAKHDNPDADWSKVDDAIKNKLTDEKKKASFEDVLKKPLTIAGPARGTEPVDDPTGVAGTEGTYSNTYHGVFKNYDNDTYKTRPIRKRTVDGWKKFLQDESRREDGAIELLVFMLAALGEHSSPFFFNDDDYYQRWADSEDRSQIAAKDRRTQQHSSTWKGTHDGREDKYDLKFDYVPIGDSDANHLMQAIIEGEGFFSPSAIAMSGMNFVKSIQKATDGTSDVMTESINGVFGPSNNLARYAFGPTLTKFTLRYRDKLLKELYSDGKAVPESTVKWLQKLSEMTLDAVELASKDMGGLTAALELLKSILTALGLGFLFENPVEYVKKLIASIQKMAEKIADDFKNGKDVKAAAMIEITIPLLLPFLEVVIKLELSLEKDEEGYAIFKGRLTVSVSAGLDLKIVKVMASIGVTVAMDIKAKELDRLPLVALHGMTLHIRAMIKSAVGEKLADLGYNVLVSIISAIIPAFSGFSFQEDEHARFGVGGSLGGKVELPGAGAEIKASAIGVSEYNLKDRDGSLDLQLEAAFSLNLMGNLKAEVAVEHLVKKKEGKVEVKIDLSGQAYSLFELGRELITEVMKGIDTAMEAAKTQLNTQGAKDNVKESDKPLVEESRGALEAEPEAPDADEEKGILQQILDGAKAVEEAHKDDGEAGRTLDLGGLKQGIQIVFTYDYMDAKELEVEVWKTNSYNSPPGLKQLSFGAEFMLAKKMGDSNEDTSSKLGV